MPIPGFYFCPFIPLYCVQVQSPKKELKMSFKLSAILEIGKHLHQRGLMVSGDGNISYRQPNGEIVMTPAGVNKSRLNRSDLARLDENNRILEGKPSSERLMHLEIYKAVPEAQAVVHAHPPHAIAISLAQPDWKELPVTALPEVILAAGRIPIVPYARPGTLAMGLNLLPYLPEHRLMILARHGAVCWGESLEEAADGIERLEQICTILKLTQDMGGSQPLPESELWALRQLRTEIGPRII